MWKFMLVSFCFCFEHVNFTANQSINCANNTKIKTPLNISAISHNSHDVENETILFFISLNVFALIEYTDGNQK